MTSCLSNNNIIININDKSAIFSFGDGKGNFFNNIGHVNCIQSRFLDPDRSLNRKRERFKVFEVEPRSNCDDVIINLIIN